MAAHKVRYEPSGTEVRIDPASAPFSGTGEPGSLLDIALANGVEIEHGCGGMGACGMCAVKILTGAENLAAPDEDERDTLRTFGKGGAMRLACQTIVKGDVVVRVA